MSEHETTSIVPASSNSAERGHETTDLNPRVVLISVVGLGVILVLGILGMYWMFWSLQRAPDHRDERTSPLAEIRLLPPDPQLQVVPGDDLHAAREREARWLSSYDWIDREAGIVRIPVERAMDLLLVDGFPARPSRDE